jgi:hypothetical protein
MNVIKFITNNSAQYPLSTGYDKNIYIGESANAKFVGLQIDNHLNWKNQHYQHDK